MMWKWIIVRKNLVRVRRESPIFRNKNQVIANNFVTIKYKDEVIDKNIDIKQNIITKFKISNFLQIKLCQKNIANRQFKKYEAEINRLNLVYFVVYTLFRRHKTIT